MKYRGIQLLKAFTVVVTAMGIVAIIAACLWDTPMRAGCIVGGIIAFAGGLILATSIRDNEKTVPLQPGSRRSRKVIFRPEVIAYRQHELVIDPARVVVGIVLVAAIAITWWFYTHPPL